jgi:hypothetical protein
MIRPIVSHSSVDGALGGFAEQHLDLGEGVLDRVEVGAVWRQEQEICTGI